MLGGDRGTYVIPLLIRRSSNALGTRTAPDRCVDAAGAAARAYDRTEVPWSLDPAISRIPVGQDVTPPYCTRCARRGLRAVPNTTATRETAARRCSERPYALRPYELCAPQSSVHTHTKSRNHPRCSALLPSSFERTPPIQYPSVSCGPSLSL